VIQAASGEHRNATTLAASSGLPMRCIGLFAAICFLRRGGIQPVSLGPGLIALTVIPREASSAALDTVIHSIAPLLAA
jgi:hypothetical protein